MSWLFSHAMIAACANSPSSLALGEGFLPENFSAGARSAPSNSTPMPQAYLWHVKMTDSWNRFPSAMTCASLTDDNGADMLTWFREDFHVRTLAPSSVAPPASPALAAGSGVKWRALSQNPDPDLFSSKTARSSSAEGSMTFSGTLPRWGMMQNGELSERTTPVFPTSEKESGLWASPSARDWKDTPGMSRRRKDRPGLARLDQLPRQVYASLDGSKSFIPATATPTETVLSADTIMRIADVSAPPWKNANTESSADQSMAGQGSALLNPNWVEWLAGLPIGWTASGPLETSKFQAWRDSLGEY